MELDHGIHPEFSGGKPGFVFGNKIEDSISWLRNLELPKKSRGMHIQSPLLGGSSYLVNVS